MKLIWRKKDYFQNIPQTMVEMKWGSKQKNFLGKPSREKSAVFLTLFKKPLTPPPLSFEHYVVNFSEGILTKVRKRLSRQLSTK